MAAMLNDLLLIARSLANAGIDIGVAHADIKDAAKKPTMLVEIEDNGAVASVRPVPGTITLWTHRNAQHNSFPFITLKEPLLSADPLQTRPADREELLQFLGELSPTNANLSPQGKFRIALEERLEILKSVTPSDGLRKVIASIEWFLKIKNESIRDIVQLTKEGLKANATDDWKEVALAILIGKNDKVNPSRSGALLFQASGMTYNIYDSKVKIAVINALSEHDRASQSDTHPGSNCALSGQKGQLLTGNFPQPTLPIVGQTYIYAKNKDIPATSRYARFSVDSMHIGREVANRLAAALKCIVREDWQNTTWRGLPGEKPNQQDLLLAYVDTDRFIEVNQSGELAGLLADDDLSEESCTKGSDKADSIAAFEKRTSRLLNAFAGKSSGNIGSTPVAITVLRKLDQVNRKIVHAATPSVQDIENASRSWIEGERNVPHWIGKTKRRQKLHVAPLGLIALSREQFIRAGTEKQEVTGITASEALSVFLYTGASQTGTGRQSVGILLKLVLRRRAAQLSRVSHVCRRGCLEERKKQKLTDVDWIDALRTVTVLGLLLKKLNRTKEVYMASPAFRLGQLLAAADAVHAGYCADIRGGDMPPSLLGNQVFVAAQISPETALAMLCRRWKPYAGWAAKRSKDERGIRESIRIALRNVRELKTIAAKLKDSLPQHPDERGIWERILIVIALRNARELKTIAAELKDSLPQHPNDVFRAELLLGYMAGLPRKDRDPSARDTIERNATSEEDET